MGMLRQTAIAALLAVGLVGCGSEAAPPAATRTSGSTDAPAHSTSPTPTSPVAPAAAKTHTTRGAKAFVRYYMEVITYAEHTLDTRPLEAASLRSCDGCWAGIEGLHKIAKQRGVISGGGVSASGFTTGPIGPDGVVPLAFYETSGKEMVAIPGNGTVMHPAGKHIIGMTLLAVPHGWKAESYELQQ